jgi:predicted GNAT family N-acyltransferase
MFLTKIEFATPAYDELLTLRQEVLLKPLGISLDLEEITAEYAVQHYALYSNDFQLLGGAILNPDRILNEEGEETVPPQKAEIQQVVIRSDVQSQGAGHFMIDQLERAAVHQGIQELRLLAIADAVPFYQSLDYKKQGRMTKIHGHKHAKMLKKISLEDYTAVDSDEIFEDL